MKRKDRNTYPKGLKPGRVRQIIAYYDHQTDAAAAAEIERSEAVEVARWIRVPADLVPAVKRLITRRRMSA